MNSPREKTTVGRVTRSDARGGPAAWVGWVGGGGACASGNQGQIFRRA
jgi:hypothetical protein